MEYYLSGILLRSGQIVVDSAIWIAFGCFIAAILRNMVGPDKTRTLFGDNSRFGLIIGWAIGMLLPVCSLGVIPVLAELYRVRVKPGTIVAFGLTAPLFNPISILYGLSLSDPIAILVFAAAAVVIVTGVGALWGRFTSWDAIAPETNSDQPKADPPKETVEIPETGVRRSIGVLYSASKSLIGQPLIYLLIGILTSAVVATSFPSGSLQTATEHDDVWAPAFMAVYTTPVYSTPLLAMSQIGGMFQHGNSVGAAFALLILGAGVNLGVLLWFGFSFGLKRVLFFLVLLFAITLGLAYGLSEPLYPEGVEVAGHTHAFDIYTHPYHKGDGLLARSVADVREYQLKNGWAGPYLLLGLALIGLVFAGIEARYDLQKWLLARVPKKPNDWDIALPPWLIGMVACAGLVAASVVGTYLYYPKMETALADLSNINGVCVIAAKTGDYDVVTATVPYCDDLSRRLEVGVYLRTGEVSEYKRAKAEIYREKLDEMRDLIDDGITDNIDEVAMEVQKAYLRMSRAFREIE